jgi:energy-dependent translational throttle protein EttA
MASRAYVAAFGFKGGDQQKKVGSCSGGERNRIHLAKLLQNEANLLLLDEPTNDLDVDTLRGARGGPARVRRLCRDHEPRPVVPRQGRDPHPRVRGRLRGLWFEGSFSEYEEDLVKRKGEDALNPTRIKYKPLQRRVG